VHIGEFMELLRRLAPEEAQFLEEGRAEVGEMAAATGGEGAAPAAGPAAELTIGNLREGES
jgi:hypothetical protein